MQKIILYGNNDGNSNCNINNNYFIYENIIEQCSEYQEYSNDSQLIAKLISCDRKRFSKIPVTYVSNTVYITRCAEFTKQFYLDYLGYEVKNSKTFEICLAALKVCEAFLRNINKMPHTYI